MTPEKPDSAEQLLKDLAAHLAYGAGVNGSSSTPNPYGTVALSTKEPDHLYARILKFAGYSTAEQAEMEAFRPMVQEIKKQLS